MGRNTLELESPKSLLERARRILGSPEASGAGLLRELLALARGTRESGRPREAEELAALAADLDPWHAPAWAERARASLELGEAAWARYYEHRALAADPDFRS